MLKTTGLSDIPIFKSNNSNGEVIRFDIGRDTNRSLNQKID